jgi:hypothetical protein
VAKAQADLLVIQVTGRIDWSGHALFWKSIRRRQKFNLPTMLSFLAGHTL